MSSSTKPTAAGKFTSAICVSAQNSRKTKVVPDGGVKKFFAIVTNGGASTTIQSTACSKSQGGDMPKGEARVKEIHKNVPTSLQQMKGDALKTLKQRRKSLFDALQYITAVIKPSIKDEAKISLEKSIKILADQIKEIGEDISRLKLLAHDFDTEKITGVDAQAIAALASWGASIDSPSTANTVYAQPSEQEHDVLSKAIDSEIENLYTDHDVNTTASSQESQATEISEPSTKTSQTRSSTPANPPSKPRPTSKAFIKKIPTPKPKPKPLDVSTTTTTINKEEDLALKRLRREKALAAKKAATKIAIIDANEALRAQHLSEGTENKQKKDKSNPASFAKKGAGNINARMRVNSDGELVFRKTTATAVGEKRKRTSLTEMPRKRDAVEGRNFKPMRARRALVGGTAMDGDGGAGIPGAARGFTS